MKKKIFIGIAVIVLFAIGYVGYALLNTKSHSPFKETIYAGDDLDILVAYCQPFKKERNIFGEASEGALLPNGEYWRVGANDATEIEFSRDIQFGTTAVPAGRYSLYAVPGATEWSVTLNSAVGYWGAFAPDKATDVATVQVPVETTKEIMEQLTINFLESDGTVNMSIHWDDTRVTIPITKK